MVLVPPRVPLLVFAVLAAGCDVEPTPLPVPVDTGPFDGDGDGYLPSVDCDDTDPEIHPAAVEVCDGVDNDCAGGVDDGTGSSWYPDRDGDGFGDGESPIVACDAPAGTVANGEDCDDHDGATSPAAEEACNDADDDCDGETDDGATVTYFRDADGDGHGDPAGAFEACDLPEGYAEAPTDCDDGDATVSPDAPERCDGIDDDCDGASDEDDAVDRPDWYADADGDGFGDAAVVSSACAAPAGTVADATDCDDSRSDVWPGAEETCDDTDQDCDGDTDEDASDALAWYADHDEDGFGDATSVAWACDTPRGFVAEPTDCDDDADDVSPAAAETCDGRDEDCDGTTDEAGAAGESTWYADADADGTGDAGATTSACDAPTGYVARSDDCDDTRADISPLATEVCDAADTDEDCDGVPDDADEDASGAAVVSYPDHDGDGYGDPDGAMSTCDGVAGWLAHAGDCDDGDATVNPDGTEDCDGADDDCDGTVDDDPTDGITYFADDDGDGFGDPGGATANACASPVGYRLDATDCDDTDDTVHPYAWDDDDDGVDDDCDGYADADDPDPVGEGPTGDDEGTLVTLTGTSFPFCGTEWTELYMQSNGRVTFGEDDTDLSESPNDLEDETAIAVAWDDLRPAETSDVAWIEHADAVALHWIAVPEFGSGDENTFSAIFFDDGRILLEYGALGMRDGLAGMSCAPGHSPAESDLGGEMAALVAGRWGVGTGADTMLYERFTSDNDLAGSVVRLCGNPDGATDPCAE